MDNRFLDNFLNSAAAQNKPVSLEYFIRHAEIKDLFGFAVYYSDKKDKNNEHLHGFLDGIWVLFSSYYDEQSINHKLICDYFEYMLYNYTKEKNVILKEESVETFKYNINLVNNAAEYLFALYNADYGCDIFYFDYVSDENLWMEYVLRQLDNKINEIFLREWETIKQYFSTPENQEYLLRSRFFGFNFLDSHSLRNIHGEDFFEYNGLSINKQFIHDNNLINADEMAGWVEGIVNLAFKELGLKYHEEKIKDMNKFMNTEEEMEVDTEMER